MDMMRIMLLSVLGAALAQEECVSGTCSMSRGTAMLQRSEKVEKSAVKDDAEAQSVEAPAAPEGFSGPMAGYCKLENGEGPENSPYGLGVVERDSVEACGAYCKEIEAPRTCRGFNYAPGVHNQCHLFGEHPQFGDGSWGWQCYPRNLVAAEDVPPVEEGTTCTDSNNGAEDKERNRCDYYNTYPGMCGQYDDDDFTASSMCCACASTASTDDAEQGTKACKSWCYNDKHVDRPWSGSPNVKNNKCDWVNCALCPECDGHAETAETR